MHNIFPSCFFLEIKLRRPSLLIMVFDNMLTVNAKKGLLVYILYMRIATCGIQQKSNETTESSDRFPALPLIEIADITVRKIT